MNKKILIVGAAALAGYFLLNKTSAQSTNDVTGGGTSPSLFTLGNAKKDETPSTSNYVSNYTFDAPTFPAVDSAPQAPSAASGTSKKEEASSSKSNYTVTSITPVSIEKQRALVAGITEVNAGQTKKEGAVFNPNINVPSNLTERLNSSGMQSSVAPAFNFDILKNTATKKDNASSKAWWQLW
jgi:hypothetical protein